MHARALRRLLVVAALVATLPVAASESGAPSCSIPGEGLDPLANRAELLAEYERLPQPCLQALFGACNEASGQGLLDPAGAAVCSFGYEALLRRGFGGSFPALMAWWRGGRPAALQ